MPKIISPRWGLIFFVSFPWFVPPALHTWAIIISRASGTHGESIHAHLAILLLQLSLPGEELITSNLLII